jgi:tetratricopeptide (TPR) repeat protein
MDETTLVSVPVDEALSPQPDCSAVSLHPMRRLRLLSWIVRVIRGSFAGPRYLIRYPGRSLALATLFLLITAIAARAGTYLWAAYHLRAAREALDRYHTNAALPHLQICLAVWFRDPETLLLAARTARRLDAFDQADHYLDQYQELRGKDDESLVIERVLVHIERGELDDLVSRFCQALVERNHPATPLILEALAKGHLRMYRPRDAEKVLNQWLQRQPDNPQALLIQARIYGLDLRLQNAIASYRRVLTVDPEMDEARGGLCESLMQLGLSDEALPHLEYLSRRTPDNLMVQGYPAMVQVYLARARDQMGSSDEAEKILAALLARQPDYGPALAERGKLALRAGRTIEAEKWLRQAIARFPGDLQAHYHLVLCLEKNGKSEEARNVQARLQRIEEDIKRIQEISLVRMQQSPHDPKLHTEVGKIALRAGAIEEGLRWLHSALKEDPDYKPAHQTLMEYYEHIHDFGRAAEHRRKAGQSARP